MNAPCTTLASRLTSLPRCAASSCWLWIPSTPWRQTSDSLFHSRRPRRSWRLRRHHRLLVRFGRRDIGAGMEPDTSGCQGVMLWRPSPTPYGSVAGGSTGAPVGHGSMVTGTASEVRQCAYVSSFFPPYSCSSSARPASAARAQARVWANPTPAISKPRLPGRSQPPPRARSGPR